MTEVDAVDNAAESLITKSIKKSGTMANFIHLSPFIEKGVEPEDAVGFPVNSKLLEFRACTSHLQSFHLYLHSVTVQFKFACIAFTHN
jgi:hypothetical protein